MANNIITNNTSLVRIFALGAVVVGLVVAGTFVYSSGTDNNSTAVTATANEDQTSTVTTTTAPVEPANAAGATTTDVGNNASEVTNSITD